MADEPIQNEQPAIKASVARRIAQQQALAARAHWSYWPFVLAVALFVTLIGLLANLVVFIVGVALMATAVIGWSLEHR